MIMVMMAVVMMMVVMMVVMMITMEVVIMVMAVVKMVIMMVVVMTMMVVMGVCGRTDNTGKRKEVGTGKLAQLLPSREVMIPWTNEVYQGRWAEREM